ncbi:MAG TPA: RNA-binding domain-containing protein [Anaerolineales bacterium]|nr:RNA-binding domain-containing protein [Anaerolineales bacterium]
MPGRRGSPSQRQWRVMDLHIHTPASNDYQEPDVTYMDVLRRCEARGLDIVAFADHNTVAGYRRMLEQIQQYELLEKLGRLTPEEAQNLAEYRRLRQKVLVLPAFEFTATFGFHILGVFSPSISIRELEHLLLSLNIPADRIDLGSSTVGATADVLTAYRLIDEAGGLAIAAHANSSNGVAMVGFSFGGQTKIAYTQDPHLHALEITDLIQKGRSRTAAFFSGIKPEYPRRMHVIQGSDAHRLRTDPLNKKNLGVGDRATEVSIDEVSFEALRELFLSQDFARARAHEAAADEPFDFIRQAQEEGPSIVQDFHESMAQRGGRLYAIISDICAFANTNGGTLYIGLEADASKPPVGVPNPAAAVRALEKEIRSRISPQIACQVDTQDTRGKTVIRVLVPRGEDPPYAVDDNKVYVRDEAETGLAVRDEIVQLVQRAHARKAAPESPVAPAEVPAPPVVEPASGGVEPPRTGVEVAEVEDRDGVRYYTMRDLRNGNVVKNVTKSSARRLWHYAISEFSALPADLHQAPIQWQGDLGVLKEQRRGKRARFDLAQRTEGRIRLFFGVTDDGIHGEWKRLVGAEVE